MVKGGARVEVESVQHLPTYPTALVGREREIALLQDRMKTGDPRLLTLTGAGGTGKTRLAVAVCAELREVFADGVKLVELASLADAELVLPTIARELNVELEETGRALLETLQDFLRDRHLLLVLDNCEQVLAGVADCVSPLLMACPRLSVLTTSREPLHIYGEHEFPVPPLDVPNLAALPAVENLGEISAIALFTRRAQAVQPHFSTLRRQRTHCSRGVCASGRAAPSD
jgi:predicted ATPase